MPVDFSHYRQVGAPERHYGAAHVCSPIVAGVGITRDAIHAVPFVESRGGTLDELIFWLGTAGSAGAKARMGLYTNKRATILYPDALVVDGGEVAIDSGVLSRKIFSISVTLTPNLYWIALLFGGTSNISTDGIQGGYPILGIPSDLTGSPGGWLRVAQSYGALPNPYPTGASILSSIITPNLMVRYST